MTSRNLNTISIIGLGYIGLPTAAMFAASGKKVIGVDINQNTVDIINSGSIHIIENGLESIVNKAVNEGYLRASTKAAPADVFIIAVPTPFLPLDAESEIPRPDLSYIHSAVKGIAKVLKKNDLVILESTSPVGATEQMSNWLSEERQDLTFPQTHGIKSDIRIAHCPERVLPGNVINELVTNSRVIGGMTPRCSELSVELYKTFVKGECTVTNSRTAEMAKLTENASRDVSIAFANELSLICDKLGINVWELIDIANLHPRVNILQPGPGVGGHCIAVDPWFIVSNSPDEAKLINLARKVNDSKPEWVMEKIKKAIKLSSKKEVNNIVCLGLAFKPNIDDLRESPAMNIVKKLASSDFGNVFVVEPNIKELPPTLNQKVELIDLKKGLDLAHIIVVLVGHSAFDVNLIKNKSGPVIIDTCGLLY
ncbi:UDP-N-acetyl-D-mannosamine dehydrogenase [Gammaproteobacteria bacterium]|nr:UDP-N-acetyl-D-mannosamine dehydrogenase [Gammaproteobacteria bacterium]